MFTRSQTVYKLLTLATLMALILGSLANPVASAGGMTTFKVRIENISGGTVLPSPFSPGVWATHSDPAPFFTVDAADRGDGLAAIAEDGNPSMLAAALAGQAGIANSGAFNTPLGANGPAPILPGEAYEFTVQADPTNRYLSLASMFVQSNDVFIGPDESGIALFDQNDMPISGDVSDQVPFWDAGTEVNQAPGMGPNQAPRQTGANTGPTEGVVSVFSNSTRSLPLANGIASITVSEASGTFSITLENISATSGAIDTPIAPVFWATHDSSWQLFTTGQPDDGNGLETLAEDGSPADLVAAHTGAAGTSAVGAAGNEAIGSGQQFQFSVTPDANHPYVTIAAMVVQTNDAFLAFGSEGVALLQSNGTPRSAADVSADMAKMLAVWDAGTEANEVPGVGPNQVLQQAAGNTGPADPDNTVRLYADSTNDLAGGNLGGFTTLTITHSSGTTFDVTLTNASDSTVYPGVLTPMLWAVHDNSVKLFQTGTPASAGLQSLAEDGDGSSLQTALAGMAGVSSSAIAASNVITAGRSFTATVTLDANHRYLSLASMVVPSNDTFAAFGPAGIALLNEDGTPRTNDDIAADIAAEFIAWDAGTERNQAGAAGPDQAPRQAGPNTGADEGNALVRLLSSPDPVWSYPNVSDVVRVTVMPVQPTTEFMVRIENISGGTVLPSPFSPGVWATHSDPAPFFTVDAPDRGDGLAAIAEDGDPSMLAAALAGQAGIANSGAFNTPLGANGPAPIFPGQAYEFTVQADPSNRYLSLASMFVQSNDVFIGPNETGIALFDQNDMPISGDVSDQVPFWDAGTEVNEAPGMGPNQAPRQGGADTGPTEGVVSVFSNSTRSLPLANGIASITVSEASGTFSITLENISATSGAIDTPIAPVFWATHDSSWQLFTTGQPDDGNGLETLAEDGSPANLVAAHTGAAGTSSVGAAGDAPIGSGQQFQFSVTPDANHPYVTIAAMVVQTNDAFLAFGPEGVALLGSNGRPRLAADVSADMAKMLAVWDAGTEANEVPGVGPNQVLQQAAGNTGPDDPDSNVRLYADSTNDLAGGNLGGFTNLTITHSGGTSFDVTLTNASDGTLYPGILTPMLWAVHDNSVKLFQTGTPASAGLESLAEDGDASTLQAALAGMAGVSSSAIAASNVITAGRSFTATVTLDANHRYLSLASMVVPSNDTFAAFGPAGIVLLNQDGTPRTDAEIAADITAEFIAWDAGTERNQAGAAGPDQAPRQAAPNTGADEGNALVRLLSSPDPVWSYPNVSDVVRVTVMPVEPTTEFTVRIENISGGTVLPSPFSPGVWATHRDPAPFFTVDAPDRGQGLAAIAEDGNPSMLAAALAGQAGIANSGAFNTPVGANGPAPILPGEAYEFTVQADPTNRYLSLASMFVQSNDIFIGPGESGIALFDDNGQPILGDVSDQVPFWDAGTEVNEAPGMGPNQAPRQPGANTGPVEGVVSVFTNSTRSLPLANGIASITVSEASGTFTITLQNVSATSGAINTPIAPVFWATHDSSWQLFTTGQPDDGNGLETLAEDGSPADLVAAHTGAAGTSAVGAAGDAPIGSGQQFQFSVTPDANHPYVTIAAMVVQSNDAFLAFGPEGVALLGSNGRPRLAADVSADMAKMLAVWDAGTEANEVPGVGPNQVLQQAAGNTGPVDPDTNVRLYADSTNDLAGGNLGGFTNLTITHSGGTSFDVTLTNASDGTLYPGILTPMLWAVHDNSVKLFQTGTPASAGLQSLAEDGDASTLQAALAGMAGVSSSAIAASNVITAGGSFTATVTLDANHRYLSLASMVVPSNDTFAAFGPAGIVLLNQDGTPRTDAEIAADITAEFIAWDAGTERNQAGAAGPDQAPRQAAANTGADEGNALVRLLSSPDPVWSYPNVSDVVRVTVMPVEPTTEFTVRIENISGGTVLPSPFSPGVWATHRDPAPFFTVDAPDRGQGLAAIAEDGNPSMLAAALAGQAGIANSGAFNTPVGANGPAPILPGEAYEFTVQADPTNRYLSLASMFVQSNDIFIGPGESGIALFDDNGQPILGDVSDQVPFWDAGTEVNEAPGMGPNQAPRQPGANTGPVEGVVSVFTNSTRSLPLANGMASITVSEANGTFDITLQNVSATSGAINTPIAPVFWATHDSSWQLFTTGQPDDGNGLETLAEDGSPADLVAAHTGAAGTSAVGAAGNGPIASGEQFQFSVTPDAAHPYVTIAAMVVQSNDAFLAFGPEGVALLDSNGTPRSAADVRADMAKMLAVWDAGTEANEVPGVGANQAPRQAAGNTGADDPDSNVRLYADSTNDLAGGNLGGFTNLTITHSSGTTFDVTLTNASDSTVYPGVLTPMLWAVHDNSVKLFQTGTPASAGLESLAEDGDASSLQAALAGMTGVSNSAIAASNVITAGGSFTATVTLDANHRYLSLASMVVPSNDTFAAFGPAGIVLLNQDGTPRTDAEIAADITAEFIAWDAGTERNQAGAAGPDQAPRQAGPNTGADEGNALVRLLGGQLRSPESTDSVWSYPNVSDVVRVTVMQPAPTALSLNRFETNNRSDANTLILGLLSLGFLAGLVIGVRRRQKKD